MQSKDNSQIAAVILSVFLALLLAVSLIAVLSPKRSSNSYVADIYQNGELLQSVALSGVDSPYTFTVEGEDHCTNQIEVRRGSIAVISADCPDKLCVGQGFISDSRIPITCLPNRLVIVLRAEDEAGTSADTPDAVTY